MTWRPLLTSLHYGRPDPGDLIAAAHTVWRVLTVEDLELTDDDTAAWISSGMPTLWTRRPYRVTFEYVGGVRPSWAIPDRPVGRSGFDVRGGGTWRRYNSNTRWPMCSCCGEPMPCRAEVQDQAVTAAVGKIEELSTRQPGDCWHCGTPITKRHLAVTYDGDNLDLPIGPTVRYHLRNACRHAAEAYELRWIAADPRRERILTYPRCAGTLIVHQDGSTNCRSGTPPWGAESERDCRGYTTHDHNSRTACYIGGYCNRACTSNGHPGATPAPRPARRDERTLL